MKIKEEKKYFVYMLSAFHGKKIISINFFGGIDKDLKVISVIFKCYFLFFFFVFVFFFFVVFFWMSLHDGV